LEATLVPALDGTAVEVGSPIYAPLVLLRILHGVAVHWRYAVPGGPTAAAMSLAGVPTPAEFVSAKLTAKLLRQLQDPVALCSGVFPAWLTELTTSCPFLFSYEARTAFLRAHAFGHSRALMVRAPQALWRDATWTDGLKWHWDGTQRLQEQTRPAGASASATATTDDRDHVRVGRIPRQKVRVRRTQLLEAAMTVLDQYGSSRTMLEIEFFDEIGVGLVRPCLLATRAGWWMRLPVCR
jgi:hypothetical protein